jgi:hypothetical protein
VDNITKLLKGFVIAGGVALVVGTAVLIALIVLRAPKDPDPGPAASSTAAAERCSGGTPSPQPLPVKLPAGARIAQIVPDGNCLILLGVASEGRPFVALVDPVTGERISLLVISPEP